MSKERSIDVQPDTRSTVFQPVGRAWSVRRERRRRGVLLFLIASCFSFALYTLVFRPNGWFEKIILPGGAGITRKFNSARLGFLTTSPTGEGRVDSTIPTNEIRFSGLKKDSIPSLSAPQRVTASQADFLKPEERVLGVVFNGDAAAYPLRILNYHEAVNDQVGGRPVLITYNPLCDSAAVFDRTIGDRALDFGISGYLYNSDMLLYDRDSEGASSLWSQLKSESVTGRRATWRLVALPLELTEWSDWMSRYPQTRVISDATGHRRDYSQDPYQRYAANEKIVFAPKLHDGRLPQKSRVLGLWTAKVSRAYVLPDNASAAGTVEFTQDFDGNPVRIHYNAQAHSLRVVQADPSVKWMYAYWFAWYAFHPTTEAYTLSGSAEMPVIALPAGGATQVR